MNPIIDLADRAARDPDLVGRKAAGLACLLDTDLAIVPGVVLRVGAPDEDAEQVATEAVRRWARPLAVRSSTRWEDHATSAQAGQGLTVLDVRGVADTVAAIAACRRAPLPDGRQPGEGVAVLVQPMVDPSFAGVAFTADPMSGERDVVRISAVEGVAAALLGGDVVGIDLRVRRAAIAGDRGAMSRADILAVAEVARRIEAHLGPPQDVEWAMCEGTVHVLQARPITVLPVRPELPTGNGWQKDVAHYSEAITPFGWWVMQSGTGDVIGDVFAQAGLLIDGLEEVLVGGEAYGRIRPAIGSADPGRMPPPPAVVLGAAARVVPVLRRRAAAARRVVDGSLTDRWIADWVDHDRAHFVARADELRGVELGALDDAGLVAHMRELRADLGKGGRAHFRVFIPYALALHELHRTLSAGGGWSEVATASLLTGASPATMQADDEMAVLRQQLVGRDDVRARLQAAPGDPLGVLAARAPDLVAGVAAWIERHGWRALNYDAGSAVLAEKPSLITQLLLTGGASTLAESTATALDAARQRVPPERTEDFERALARARMCYPLREDTAIVAGDLLLGFVRRWLIEVGARLVERGVLGRGADASYLVGDEIVASLRGDLDEATVQALVQRRRGEEAWTRVAPGPLTIGRQGAPPDISRLPAAMRQVNEAILWYVALEYPGVADADAGGDALVRGIGASPGSATGRVRVVKNHPDLARLEAGEVLVCQVASPAWAPVLPLCAAVVADGGGALSHAAIAAREHGIPAVLGCQSASAVLHTGQMVHVDGATGLVSNA